MLFNLCIHLKSVYVTSALAVGVFLYLLSLLKEHLDDRKRA